MLDVFLAVFALMAAAWALGLAILYLRCELAIRRLQRELARREAERVVSRLPTPTSPGRAAETAQSGPDDRLQLFRPVPLSASQAAADPPRRPAS